MVEVRRSRTLRSRAGRREMCYRRSRCLGISRFWSPSTGTRLRQPGDLLWAVPGVRPTASWLSGPVYRSVRPRPRRGTRRLGRVSERSRALSVASYWLASGLAREPASSTCNLVVFPSVETRRPLEVDSRGPRVPRSIRGHPLRPKGFPSGATWRMSATLSVHRPATVIL